MNRFKVLVPLLASGALAACGGGTVSPPASASASPNPAVSASRPASSAGSLASAKPAASKLTTVKAAYSQISAAQAAMYIAIDKGFFANHGVDVQLTQVGGTQQIPAMTAGELQFGTPGGNELVSSVLAGAPMVGIAVSSNYPIQSLYGGKGVTDVKQVAGKAVAITTAGSTSEAGAKIFLRHYGLDTQVQYQPAGTVAGVAAVLEKGDAAAGVTSPPTTIALDKAGLVELVNGPKLGEPMVHAAITVTRDYLKNNSDLVKRYLQAYLEGWRFARDAKNADAMVNSIAKWTKSPPDVAKASYQYVVVTWQRDEIPAFSDKAIENILSIVDNPKAKTAKPSDFYDNSLITSIAK